MDKQLRILDAARTLFAQFGLNKVTTDDIARNAGISKATIYKLYPNKQAIFDDVIALETDDLIRVIKDAAYTESTTQNRLRAYLLTKLTALNELNNLYHVTRVTFGNIWPHIADARDRVMNEEKQIVRQILKAGVKSGELSVPNAALTAHVLVTSFRQLEFNWVLESHPVSLEKHVDHLLDIVMHGIGKDRAKKRAARKSK